MNLRTSHAGEWKTLDFLAWLYNHAPNRDEVVVNVPKGKREFEILELRFD